MHNIINIICNIIYEISLWSVQNSCEGVCFNGIIGLIVLLEVNSLTSFLGILDYRLRTQYFSEHVIFKHLFFQSTFCYFLVYFSWSKINELLLGASFLLKKRYSVKAYLVICCVNIPLSLSNLCSNINFVTYLGSAVWQNDCF